MSAPWLDNLPSGWREVALRYLARVETGSRDTVDAVPGGDYPFIIRSRKPLQIDSYSYDTEAVLTAGDGAIGEIFHHLKGKFEAHQRVYVIHDFRGLLGRFFFYYFSSEFSQTVAYGGAQSTVASLRRPMLTNFPVALPPLKVQRAIVDYLDRETAQIDAFIAKNEELITLLTERRVAAIDARILKSGGNRIALQRVLRRIRQGWSPNCENSPADGISDWGVLKVGCSNTGQFDPRENKKLPASEKPRPDLVVAQDEIVMSRSNTRELVGAAAVVSAQYPRLMLSDLTYGITVRSEILPEYLAWQLRGRLVRGQIETAAKGTSSSMQKLSQRDIRELQIMCPPMADQRAVVDDLNRLAAASDSARQASLRAIELARERRAALISAAVTGKIDVGVAA